VTRSKHERVDSYRSLDIRWRSSGRGDGDVRSSPAFEAALNTLASVADAIAQGIEGKRAEESLRASGQSVRLIVDGIPGLVCTMCAEGKVELVNQRALDYMGRTLEEVKVLLNCSLPRVKLVARYGGKTRV